MSAAKKLNSLTVDEYLAGEMASETKHEYLGGIVHAMAGASNRHNLIESNTLVTLSNGLRGKPCGVWNSNTKIRVQLPTQTRFYYPDTSVVCQENPDDDTYQDLPVVIVEVLSKSTRRTDEVEKQEAYQTIPSLRVYLLVEQESAEVTVYRRTEEGFEKEVYTGIDATIPLAEIDTELALLNIYDGVTFSPEPDHTLR